MRFLSSFGSVDECPTPDLCRTCETKSSDFENSELETRPIGNHFRSHKPGVDMVDHDVLPFRRSGRKVAEFTDGIHLE